METRKKVGFGLQTWCDRTLSSKTEAGNYTSFAAFFFQFLRLHFAVEPVHNILSCKQTGEDRGSYYYSFENAHSRKLPKLGDYVVAYTSSFPGVVFEFVGVVTEISSYDSITNFQEKKIKKRKKGNLKFKRDPLLTLDVVLACNMDSVARAKLISDGVDEKDKRKIQKVHYVCSSSSCLVLHYKDNFTKRVNIRNCLSLQHYFFSRCSIGKELTQFIYQLATNRQACAKEQEKEDVSKYQWNKFCDLTKEEAQFYCPSPTISASLALLESSQELKRKEDPRLKEKDREREKEKKKKKKKQILAPNTEQNRWKEFVASNPYFCACGSPTDIENSQFCPACWPNTNKCHQCGITGTRFWHSGGDIFPVRRVLEYDSEKFWFENNTGTKEDVKEDRTKAAKFYDQKQILLELNFYLRDSMVVQIVKEFCGGLRELHYLDANDPFRPSYRTHPDHNRNHSFWKTEYLGGICPKETWIMLAFCKKCCLSLHHLRLWACNRRGKDADRLSWKEFNQTSEWKGGLHAQLCDDSMNCAPQNTCYIDDVLVSFPDSKEEKEKEEKGVFTRTRNATLKRKLQKKCNCKICSQRFVLRSIETGEKVVTLKLNEWFWEIALKLNEWFRGTPCIDSLPEFLLENKVEFGWDLTRKDWAKLYQLLNHVSRPL